MKIYMKNIEVIAWFKPEKDPVPIRFKMETIDGENIVVSIGRVVFSQQEKIAGNRMILYRCSSIISDRERLYELKYEIESCKWFLYKL